MTKSRISRRTMLRGIAAGGAAVAIGLPTLDIFCNGNGTALAQGSPFPRRFGVWFWGNGMIPERWVPLTTGRDYQLSTQLQPLLAVRNDVTVLSGVSVKSEARTAHYDGVASFLAGTPLTRPGETGCQGKTIDVLVSEAIQGPTRWPAIYAGVDTTTQAPEESASYTGGGSHNPPTVEPLALYNMVFREGFPSGEVSEDEITRWNLRRSVLSAVMEDVSSLKAQLGSYDRQRLDAHLEGIRDVETRLTSFVENPPSFASCALPMTPRPEYPEVDSRPQLRERHRLVSDMLAMALACDLTRVVHTMFTRSGTTVRFPGVTTEHHELSHKTDPVSQDELDNITVQIVDEFAYFVQRLASVPEGDGRLLDNLAVLATSDCAFGAEHTLDEYPILIAGGAGGRLRTGKHIHLPGVSASRVSLSLMRAVGASVEEFGVNEARETDDVGELEPAPGLEP